MSEVNILVILLVVAVVALAIALSSSSVRDSLTPRKQKELNNLLDLEMKYFEPLGLDTYYPQYSVHALRFPHGAVKEVTFYHPEYLFKIDYDFNDENAYFVQGTYVSMKSLLAVAQNQFKANVKLLKNNVAAFQEAHGFQDVDLRTLVPLMYIFGNKPENIRIALESGMHPAIIAVLVREKGEQIIPELKELSPLPIEWLANIYDFKYVLKTREVFKVI